MKGKKGRVDQKESYHLFYKYQILFEHVKRIFTLCTQLALTGLLTTYVSLSQTCLILTNVISRNWQTSRIYSTVYQFTVFIFQVKFNHQQNELTD